MSDTRLREAERRWRESGRLDDRVRWWSERARAGEAPPGAAALIDAVANGRLPAERVELAAYLGDPAAHALAIEEVVERVAYGREDRALRVALREPDVRLEDVVEWVGALRLWDRAWLLRGWIAGARHLADVLAGLDLSAQHDEDYEADYREHERAHGLPLVARALSALEDWLEDRSRPAPSAVVDRGLHQGSITDHILDAASMIERAAAGTTSLDEAQRDWANAAYGIRPDPRALRAAVRDGVVPWALREAAS